jgi:Dolichyl-phosphate-mannose-protein mannosyltransferase
VLNAVIGAAAVLPVYGLARAWRSETAGLFAAAVYAVNLLAVRDGHFAVTDAPLCFLVACCLWACARSSLIAAGALAGAALGIKYSAAPLVVPCAICAVLALRNGESLLRAMLLPALAALLAFLLVTPSVLRDPAAFWSGVQSHEARYGGNSLPFYLGTVLPAAFGWAGFAMGMAGVANRRALPAAAFALCVIALLAPLEIRYARYASLLVPPLASGAGIALDALLQRNRIVATALAAAALLPPAVRTVQLDRLLSREDTRDLAAGWLIREGRPIESVGGWAHVHALERSAQQACASALPPHLRAPVPTLAGTSPQWGELVGKGATGWEALGAALVRPTLDRAADSQAELVAESRAPPDFDNLGPAATFDEVCWPEQARFSPGAPGIRERFDAFFVPLDSFAGAIRPGPEVIVRRRVCGNSAGTRTR